MAYDKYIDQNGIKWNIITTPDGWTMMATVLDDATPRYDPPAPDQLVKHAPTDAGALEVNNHTIVGAEPPTAEETRLIFIELVQKIEEYAGSHKPLILVRQKPPLNPLLVVGLFAAAWLVLDELEG